jgi:hypothetical protein
MKRKILLITLLAVFSLLTFSRAEAHERWPWWLPPLPPVPAVVIAPATPAPVYEPAPVYAPAPAYGYYYNNNRYYRPWYGRGWRADWRQRRLARARDGYGCRDHDRRDRHDWIGRGRHEWDD